MLGSTVRRRWLGGAMLGVAATVAGCVIESTGPTATELYRLIDAHCESAVRCGCAWAVTDEDACTTTLEARWKERLAEGLRRELTYDAACFAAMTAHIVSRGCSGADGPVRLCEGFCAPLHGDQAAGEPCEADADDGLVSNCARGLYCLDGTCTEPCAALSGRREGERCGNELIGPYDDCATGLFCSWATDLCERAPGEGEMCSGYCGVGLYCDWQSNTCRLPAGVGESCFEAECAEGLWCQYETNQCAPRATEGESCDSVPCTDELDCTYDGNVGSSTCRRPAAEGESCERVACEDALWCNENSLCVAPPEEGQACLLGFVCAEGLACDPFLLECVSPPSEGQPCPAGACADGAWCDTSMAPEGICTARRANDEMCSGHRQCQSGYCPNGFCWPLPLEGDECTGAGVCAGGLVCNGTTCEPTLTRGPAACNYAGW